MKEKKVKKGKLFTVGQEFKAFISRGNVLDMAVGVIMGSAFGAIVSAFTNILLSVCTWGVPGGLKGLVTVLPALNAGQAGMDVANGLGQSFDMSQLQTLATAEAKACGFDTANDVVIQNEMSTVASKYTLHGTTYYFNGSALIDWGTFINAIISFLIIAFSLFIVIKIFAGMKAKRMALEAEMDAKKKQEEAAKPAAPAAPAPKPDNIVLLEQIRDEIKTLKTSDGK